MGIQFGSTNQQASGVLMMALAPSKIGKTNRVVIVLETSRQKVTMVALEQFQA